MENCSQTVFVKKNKEEVDEAIRVYDSLSAAICHLFGK